MQKIKKNYKPILRKTLNYWTNEQTKTGENIGPYGKTSRSNKKDKKYLQ